MRLFLEKKLQQVKQAYHSTDILFLVFLLLFLNVRLPFKLAALVMIYALRPDFKFGISFKKKSRLPLFYLLMVGLSLLELLLHCNFSTNYLLLFSLCTSLWGIAFLVIHQVKLAIEKSGPEKVKRALEIFLVINILVSFFDLFLIMLETKSINPYTFEGLSYKYHVSTGDNIRGVMADICTTNMIINTFGLFYFMYRQRYWLSFASLCVILLTTSNLGNLILIVFFVVAFITDKSRLHKSIILTYVSVLVIFMLKISPSNLDYFTISSKRIAEKEANPAAPGQSAAIGKRKLNTDSLLLVYVKRKQAKTQGKSSGAKMSAKERTYLEIQKKLGNYKTYIQKTDSVYDKHEKSIHTRIMDLCKNLYGDSLSAEQIFFIKDHKRTPGKLVSFVETLNYMTGSIQQFVIGSGPGNFSSKMGFRALGLNIDGNWPAKYTYHSEEFKENHLKLWIYYRIQPPAEHSVTNHPNSCANQLLGEYGMIGLLLFLCYYVWFFIKRYKFLSYGRLLLPLLLVFLGTDYWFENLSVMVVFETMMLLDLHNSESVSA